MTGHSDRVVVKWKVYDIESIDAALNQDMHNPNGAAFFVGWMEKLNGLIHHSEGEFRDLR
jgi:hypothetical protein